MPSHSNETCFFGHSFGIWPGRCSRSSVAIEQAIAQGDPGCPRLVVYLKPTPEADAAQGREYFKG